MAYLTCSLIAVVIWIAMFIKSGNTCATLQSQISATANFVCGVSNAMVLFWMLLFVLAVVSSIYYVWSMIQYIKSRAETELFRYQEPFQAIQSHADEMAMEQATQAQAAHQGKFHAPLLQTPMPQYGQ